MPSLSCSFNVELKWCNNMASLLKFDGAGDEVTRNTFLQRHSASISHSDDSLLYMTRQKKTKIKSYISGGRQHLNCHLCSISYMIHHDKLYYF